MFQIDGIACEPKVRCQSSTKSPRLPGNLRGNSRRCYCARCGHFSHAKHVTMPSAHTPRATSRWPPNSRRFLQPRCPWRPQSRSAWVETAISRRWHNPRCFEPTGELARQRTSTIATASRGPRAPFAHARLDAFQALDLEAELRNRVCTFQSAPRQPAHRA